MKEKNISFSQHLLNKGIITKEQLDKALAIQNKGRLLGNLAAELGVLSEQDLLKIRDYQEANSMKFGEAAVSLGLLTRSQLKYLLDVRLRKKVRIGDILINEGFIEKEDLYRELMFFEKNRCRLKKILVCDSSTTVNDLLKSALEKYGYRISASKSPSKAVQSAVLEKTNLLIISQALGKMSGLDVCRKLLSMPEMSELNIIFMAEDIDRNLMEEAFKVGVHHFLRKPVEEYELLNIIYNIEQNESKKKKEKILVVDDGDLVRAVITRELKSHGYNVLQATNGGDALVLAKKEKPDLITMDIIMPGMDGYETCKSLRHDPATHDIPVIMVTSCDTMEERKKGFEVGAVEYFVKPFAPNQLANYIKVLFETKEVRRKERAVVIDDTMTTLYIIKYILEKEGIEVITAQNGKEGLENIRKSPPDIIISDLYMPEMDGFMLCHEIKTSPETKHIPLILLTSSGKKEDILKGLAMGANDYVIKPFDEDELMGRVNNLLANKRLYEELRSLNSQLEEKNITLKKLNKEKENFYSILTHDLKSPLTSILGFSDIVISELEGSISESMTECQKIIRSAAQRQLGIIEDALQIFHFETGKELSLEKGDMGEVIKEVILTQSQNMKKKGISITLNGGPYSPKMIGCLPCLFNSFKVTRVLENLLNNACKYAKKNIDVSFKEKNRSVEVCVHDDGRGINEEFKDKIFEDFFQIPGSEKGTGLGLSSSKRIVEAHQGKLWVDSSPERGTRFYFTIPKKGE